MPIRQGVYYIGTKRAAKVAVKKRMEEDYTVPPSEPPIGLVQGRRPGSIEEWRVALALNKMKMKYIFQYEINGGHRLRGGQIIDFLVLTRPVPTPVYVNGTYWHRTEKQMEDQLKQLHVVEEFQGQCFPPLILWADTLQTVDEAYRQLQEKLRFK